MHDQLTEKFTALADDVRGSVRVAKADTVRRDGDGQRRRAVVASTVALTIIGASGVAGANAFLSVPAASTPAGAGGVGASWGASRPTTIPADLAMPHEREKGWLRSDDVTASSPLTICNGADPTAGARLDVRTVTSPRHFQDGNTSITEQLILYPAKEVVAEIQKQIFTELQLPKPGKVCRSIPRLNSPSYNTFSSVDVTIMGADGATMIRAVRMGPVLFVIKNTSKGGTITEASYSESEISKMQSELCRTMNICQDGRPATPSPWSSTTPEPSGPPDVDPTWGPTPSPGYDPTWGPTPSPGYDPTWGSSATPSPGRWHPTPSPTP